MPAVIDSRATAPIDGDFVVFLIGMRINKSWKVHQWLPVALAPRNSRADDAPSPTCGGGAWRISSSAMPAATGTGRSGSARSF